MALRSCPHCLGHSNGFTLQSWALAVQHQPADVSVVWTARAELHDYSAASKLFGQQARNLAKPCLPVNELDAPTLSRVMHESCQSRILSCCSDDILQVLVFFTTAKLTQLNAQMCNAAGIPVLEIHSRKTQAHRYVLLTNVWMHQSAAHWHGSSNQAWLFWHSCQLHY